MLCNQASNKMSEFFHACCRHIHFRSSCGCSANCGSNFSEWSGWQVPLLLGGWKLREPMLLFMHELHIHKKFFFHVSAYKTMSVKCPILFSWKCMFLFSRSYVSIVSTYSRRGHIALEVWEQNVRACCAEKYMVLQSSPPKKNTLLRIAWF